MPLEASRVIFSMDARLTSRSAVESGGHDVKGIARAFPRSFSGEFSSAMAWTPPMWIALWMMLFLGMSCTRAAAPPAPAAVHVTTAEVWSAPGAAWTPPSSLDDLGGAERALLAVETPWQAVTLPHALPRPFWGGLQQALPDADVPEVLWYRLPLPASALAQPGARLYIPRSQTVGTVAVYVEGRLAWQSRPDRVWNNFNHPIWIDLGGLTRPGTESRVYVRVAGRPGVTQALSSVWAGPPAELLPGWRWRSFFQTGLVAYWRGSFLMLGLFALGLAAWFRFGQRQRGEHDDARPFVLFFGMAVGQSLAALLYLVGDEGLDMDFAWFSWMTLVALLGVMVCAFPFLGLVQGRLRPRLGWAVTGYAIAVAGATLPPWWTAHTAAMPLLRLLLVPPALALIAVAVADARRLRNRSSVLLATWGLSTLPMGWHDMAMQGGRLDVEGIYLTPYVNLGLLTMFLFVAFTRYTRALDTAARARATLAERLAAQECELVETHERLRAAEREQTLLHERQRLMREMHDGVGSSLMSALRLVEHGHADVDVAQMLKECIDDLKIAIDSLESVDADLLALLGALRFRLGRRLSGAGIVLHWQMSDLPPLSWLDAQSGLHVLRILQEVLTNIIKHGGADRISVETNEAPSPVDANEHGVQVCVRDNGRPFIPPPPDSLPPGRRGLANVHGRVLALGARCAWTPSEDGNTFTLWLPLRQHSGH